MTPAFKIVSYHSDDAPKTHASLSAIWITRQGPKGKHWERIGVLFEAASKELSRAKAQAFWDGQMARVARNAANKDKGRPYEYPVAPEFFRALEGLTEALQESTGRLTLLYADATDQRGYDLQAHEDDE